MPIEINGIGWCVAHTYIASYGITRIHFYALIVLWIEIALVLEW